MASNESPQVAISFTPEFKRNLRHLAKKYPHVRIDLQTIFDALSEGKREGDKIPGVQYDVYKVRAKNTDAKKGKSGGYRLIYQVVSAKEVTLVTIYSKTEQGDIAAKMIKQIIDQHEKQSG
jgi:mRNA-degrading endonuclease RelE of RelBE toxin-antitoxin system